MARLKTLRFRNSSSFSIRVQSSERESRRKSAATPSIPEPAIGSRTLSPGEQLLDLVYIDDVVDAFLMAADRLLAGQVAKSEKYAVSTGNPLSLRQVIELFEKATGQKLSIQWGKKPYREREVMVPWSLGEKLPSWSPKVSLWDGICRV